ncbi:MAG: hypothetical protein LBU81_06395 [Methanosarcinales archaeon]|jgi:hypothetical protein|nr:hypothetical protein [Methanosarcinales archaeon]
MFILDTGIFIRTILFMIALVMLALFTFYFFYGGSFETNILKKNQIKSVEKELQESVLMSVDVIGNTSEFVVEFYLSETLTRTDIIKMKSEIFRGLSELENKHPDKAVTIFKE